MTLILRFCQTWGRNRKDEANIPAESDFFSEKLLQVRSLPHQRLDSEGRLCSWSRVRGQVRTNPTPAPLQYWSGESIGTVAAILLIWARRLADVTSCNVASNALKSGLSVPI